MIPRTIGHLLNERLDKFPAVLLTGPRQAGKTTLARSFSDLYFDLEQPQERIRLDLMWDDLSQGKGLIVLDEAQSFPDVFPRIRAEIDEYPRHKGRFLLLGSVSPSLMTHVSESLAGRLSLVELTPLLYSELSRISLSDSWLFGGYPDGGVLTKGDLFPQWQSDYLNLLSQRDLPNWGLPARPQTTQRFLKMIAAVHGQPWNASQIASSMGLAHPTVNSYMDYLEGAFLVRRLPPYHANIRKRLRKTPKYYWRDTGLLHAVLQVAGRDHLLNQPWVGASWEGYVIEQVIGTLNAKGATFSPYFLRTSDNQEIDLLLDLGKEKWAIETKLTSRPSEHEFSALDRIADLVHARLRILISRTTDNVAGRRRISCSLPWFVNRFL